MAGFTALDACISAIRPTAAKLNIPFRIPTIEVQKQDSEQLSKDSNRFIGASPMLTSKPVCLDCDVDEQDVDENDMDMYMLRKKYLSMEPVSEWEHAITNLESKQSTVINGQGAEADVLFMKTLGALTATGSDNMPLLMALERLPQNNVYRFLPYYMALDQNMSRSHINEMIHTGVGSQIACSRYLTECSIQMMKAALMMVNDVEEQMAAGQRNRQEAFQRAAAKLQKRVDLWKLLT